MTARHFLAIRGLAREAVLFLVQRALDVKHNPAAVPKALAGRRVCLFFAEPSTRTKTSFALAARALGAETIDFSPSASSMEKGESLGDTVRTLRALGADLFVVRHSATGFPHRVAHYGGVPVVNAGDGMHEHPTQAILDLVTIRESLGRVERLHVALIGDVAHSRVARSHLAAHEILGNAVTLVGPPTLIPDGFARGNVRIVRALDGVLAEADVVMALRLQKERMQANAVPSLAEFHALYGLTPERVAAMRPEAILLHPGPMNPGVEITEEVSLLPCSRILAQVANGVPARIAVLESLR